MEARWNDRSLSVDDDYMNLVINNHGLIWTPNEIARNASNIVEMILAMLMANDRVRLKLEYDGNESLHRCPHRTLSHYYVLPHSYYSHTDACVYFRAGFSHRCILSLSLSPSISMCWQCVLQFVDVLACWRAFAPGSIYVSNKTSRPNSQPQPRYTSRFDPSSWRV